jgi:hypothetical protein
LFVLKLLKRCWAQNPRDRPDAKELYRILQELTIKELEKYDISGVAIQETPRETSLNQNHIVPHQNE